MTYYHKFFILRWYKCVNLLIFLQLLAHIIFVFTVFFIILWCTRNIRVCKHTEGVINALYIGNSKLPQLEKPVNDIAERMSRVSCIYYSRSVPGIPYPKGTLLGVKYSFLRGTLSARQQVRLWKAKNCGRV